VGGVVGEVEAVVEQLAQQLAGPRRLDAVDGIGCFGRGHVVGLGADAADAVCQQRHLLDRAPHAEPLKAAQLGNLEVGVGDFPLFVQEDLDLAVAFEAGNRIDGYPLHR
jgi:hypothetical protein